MLNSYYYKTETKVTPVTRVIEKTITPDKVTEMYDKVREEVENSIIASVKVEDNFLNGVVLYMYNKYDDMTKVIMTRFTVNGKDYQTRRVITPFHEADKYKLAEELHKVYVETLATEILKQNIKDIYPKKFP